MTDKLALYFGCFNDIGHYLHTLDGRRHLDTEKACPGLPWSGIELDGGLLRSRHHPDVYDGRLEVATAHDLSVSAPADSCWHGFFWWDRSVDTRGASCSAIVVRGFAARDFAEAFAYARTVWPKVFARQTVTLVFPSRLGPTT